MTVRIPATNKLISSVIPREKTAQNPITDQRTGIIQTTGESFLSTQQIKPNVKIVVGHGKPKVGVEG